jgi:predicted nucleic acid-binding protein
MDRASGWFTCRVGFVETCRAVSLVAGAATVTRFQAEWPTFSVVEIDQSLSADAVSLAIEHELRSLDALRLAAALTLPKDDLVVATWDRRLYGAARAKGLRLIPEALD